MKKRFLFPLIAAAGISALAALANEGSKLNQQYLADCNAGQTEVCAKVLNGTSVKKDMITNKEHLASVAAEVKADANAKKERLAKIAANENLAAARAKKAALWQPTKRNIQQLAYACESQNLKPSLKDPNSLRTLDQGMAELTDTYVTVWVQYTATNSFGGRVQNVHQCRYTR